MSISPALFYQQAIFIVVGLGLFFLMANIDYCLLAKFSLPIFVCSTLLLFLPIIGGGFVRGSQRWIQLGPVSFQPSEFIKPWFILFFASFFAKEEKLGLKSFLQVLLVLVVPLFLVFRQPDLGSTIVLGLIWLGIFFASGISLRYILFLVAGFGAIAPLGWRMLKDYQRQRLFSFLDPSGDPFGSGYNLIQSTVAVGSGWFFGRGWGKGTQSHLLFLPERHTDFVFASFAEEFGFLGSLILVLTIVFLLVLILRIGQKANDRLGVLICAGVFVYIFCQGFMNMGMSMGILPITGVTLPLLSYGGNSVLSVLISLGIVQNIALSKRH